jgi:hypothetical protein
MLQQASRKRSKAGKEAKQKKKALHAKSRYQQQAESVMHDKKQAGLEADGSMEDKLAVMTTRPSTRPGVRGT